MKINMQVDGREVTVLFEIRLESTGRGPVKYFMLKVHEITEGMVQITQKAEPNLTHKIWTELLRITTIPKKLVGTENRSGAWDSFKDKAKEKGYVLHEVDI